MQEESTFLDKNTSAAGAQEIEIGIEIGSTVDMGIIILAAERLMMTGGNETETERGVETETGTMKGGETAMTASVAGTVSAEELTGVTVRAKIGTGAEMNTQTTITGGAPARVWHHPVAEVVPRDCISLNNEPPPPSAVG